MNPASGDSPQPRYRSLVVAGVLVVAVVVAGVLAGHSGSGRGSPGRPQVRFGAHIQPPAGSDGGLPFNNGWIASGAAGKHQSDAVAVYAAGQPSHRQNGLLLVQREAGGGFKPWRTRTIVVRGSGALTLLRPAQPATEAQAFNAKLRFVTSNGGTGTLDLSNDRVTLNG